ncbi:reverse transcriptase domain-containing protein [Tanacetum coccineum]
MSRSADQAQTPANSVIRNTAGKGSKQAADGDSEYLPEDKLRDICEKHYNQILPIMTEKVHREKLQGVQTRLTYGESSHRNSQTREETQFSESESCDRRRRPKKRKPSPATAPRDTRPSQNTSVFSRLRRKGDKLTRRRSPTIVFTRLGHRDRNIFTRLGERRKNVHSRLGPEVAPRRRHASERRSASSNRSVEDPNHRKKDIRSLIRSYVTCSSKCQREIEEEWYVVDRASRRKLAQTKEAYLFEYENDQGGHWKSRPKKRRSNGEDNLSQPWLCEETDPFTERIWYFEVPNKTRMPANVKTYDGTGDPEDHLKKFQADAKIERWAIPTWCHMFNSTLIDSARVWFDKLPPESIDNYEILRKAFGNLSQQKKYIKDPVEIHHIKQREGESTKAFMERFKAESMHVNGEPECMRISGFMHDIANPDLIKKLNDNFPKSIDGIINVTTAFLRGRWQQPISQGRKSIQHGDTTKQTTNQASTSGRISKASTKRAGGKTSSHLSQKPQRKLMRILF